MKLVSLSHLEGFYYKPRIDKDILRKYSEGLICLSACIAGEVPVKYCSVILTVRNVPRRNILKSSAKKITFLKFRTTGLMKNVL